MKINIKNNIIFLFLLVFIFILAIMLQSSYYVNADVEWLLQCGHFLLTGKKNYYDYFELNPPLATILHAGVVLLARVIKINSYTVVLGCFFIFIAWSLWVSYRLLTQIFSLDVIYRKWVIVFIAISLLLLPIYAFAEREQFSLIFYYPYLLLMVIRFENKIIPSLGKRILLGLLTAVGICLKPYFLAPLVLVEIAYWIKLRKIFAPIRAETITMMMVMLSYVLFIYLYFPDFYFKIMPFVKVLYVPTFDRHPIVNLLSLPTAYCILACLVLAIVHLCFIKQDRGFYLIMLLAMMGFLGSYLMQGQVWYYHVYPALALSCVILASMCFSLGKKVIRARRIIWRKDGINILIAWFSLVVLIVELFFILCVGILHAVEDYNPQSLKQEIIQFGQLAANKNVLIISDEFNIQGMLFHYFHIHLSTRFPSMELIPGIRKLELQNKSVDYQHYRQLFFTMLNQDINKTLPDYILLDTDGYWFYDKKQYHQEQFMPFLLADKDFAHFFSHYQLKQKIGGFEIYIPK